MWTHCSTMAQFGRVDPTTMASMQDSIFVYK
jgi:hypothetical protein